MGLLSKAAFREEPEEKHRGSGLLRKALAKEAGPDAMGQALRDRILRLARTKSSPYTALSLLKAYAAFQAGLCVSLREGIYRDYASVGLGITKPAIPQALLEHGGGGFFKAGSAADLSLNFPRADLIFWAFPLDRHEPCETMLLLGGDDSFDPAPLESIVYDVRELLSLPGKGETAEPELTPVSEQAAAVSADSEQADVDPGQFIEEELIKFHTKNTPFQGIILDPPADRGENFSAEIAESIVSFGAAFSLPSRRCLALFPQSIDRELAAHRLTREFRAACIFSFEADTPGRALELTQPYR
jgi:hypothetical protein